MDDMRIDKYLKVSRLIKRRAVAKEACIAGKVLINDIKASPASKVKENDDIKIEFGSKCVHVRVISVHKYTRKEEAANMHEIILENDDN